MKQPKKINFKITPGSALSGELAIPGDKSISHRSIILGSIADGVTTVSGFLQGEDCLATIAAFRAMGVVIEGPVESKVLIKGVGKFGLKAPSQQLDLGNSGTSIRLLTGLLAGQTFDSVLSGDESLQQRPMERVSAPLNLMGAKVTTTHGKPPIKVSGGQQLHGITYQMPMASAQVKSCLLLAALYAKGTTSITEPGITRDHTERMLKAFAYPLTQAAQSVSIIGGGMLQATEIKVPGDISSAAFFMVAASITPGSDITLRNIGINPTRIGIIKILKKMGANITILNERVYGDEPIADICIKYAKLVGIEVPIEWVPLAIDELPVIFIAAAVAQGSTIIKGAKELRFKESDRIQAMVDGLNQLGVVAQALPDGAIIQGGTLNGGKVTSYGDHRIAMSFAIAGQIAKHQVVIEDCNNVATSFPSFKQLANSVGILVSEE